MLPELGAVLTGLGGLLAGVAAWRNTRRTHSIVQGNGQGNIARMQELTLEQLAAMNRLLAGHVTDDRRHN